MRITRALAYLATICWVQCAWAQNVESGEIQIPFRLTDQNNMVVSATINGRDKLDLMLHTAASDVTLTEEGAKKAPSVKFTEKVKMESWGGKSDSRISKGNVVQIGDLQRKNVSIFEDQLSGKSSDGKFGLDFFEKRIVEIDFDTSRISVYEKAPEKLDKFQRLPLHNQNGQLFVEASCSIDGETYTNRFLIHTGYAGGLLLDDEFAAKTGVDGKVKITEESSLKDSFGNVIKVKKGVLPELLLGDSRMDDVPMGFFAGALGKQKVSVVGCEVLKRFHLIFDMAKNELYIRPRAV